MDSHYYHVLMEKKSGPVPSPCAEPRCADGDKESAAVGAAVGAATEAGEGASAGPKLKPSMHTDPRLAGTTSLRPAACSRSSTLQSSKAAVVYRSRLFCGVPRGCAEGLNGKVQRLVPFASSSCVWLGGRDPSGVKVPAHAQCQQGQLGLAE